ncbi:NAD(P)-binding protein [Ceraceosorus guamensis]|uniref:NAD(P)-binding protein n=1 Tax=Ceraceosorus guamensis TaxID=1522189 RepID=A0A316VSS3_9BASI|nr:NAD(P)-binding protein [Ceraceosorus guamensis]PWN40646.1 NAD(P)-binding protein [Ceraceosorus guamensis]
MSTPSKTLFLIGPGFIGGTLLLKLKEVRPDLKLSALTRRKEQAEELKSLGIEPVLGSLDDVELIQKNAGASDIVIHTATADHLPSTRAAAEGIKNRADKSKHVVFIHTSGNDEMIGAAKGFGDKSVEEKKLSDAQGDEMLEERIAPDALHRQVDGPLRQILLNDAAEKAANASAAIMMPPLIYGIGAEPWRRISIQAPMLLSCMIKNGIAALPPGTSQWNAVGVHDLADAYVLLIAELEAHTPGMRHTSSHYAFPAEPDTFSWRDVFEAMVEELKAAGHPAAKKELKVLDRQAFEEFVGGKENPYSGIFAQNLYGKENAFTKPDRLTALGLRHKQTGVVASIKIDKELQRIIEASL